MLFGALFTAYLFVRLGAEDGTWPSHVQSIPLGLTNTILLIISSITMVWAWVALKERKFNTYRLALAITMLCGVLFLYIKGNEYYDKYKHWGFMIKDEDIGKYMPTLKAQDIFLQLYPEPGPSTKCAGIYIRRPTRLSLSCPTRIFIPGAAGPLKTAPRRPTTAPQTGQAEEQTVTVQKADLDRGRKFACPPMGPTMPFISPLPDCMRCTSSAASSSWAYFLGPGSRMYRRNPEQLSNRIEVTGIFLAFRRSRVDHRFSHPIPHLKL